MELGICPSCTQELEMNQCPLCGGIFVPRCPHCGNTVVFEQLNYGGATLLRCGICSNATDFELTVL
ncbi:MAG: hypothetical protein GX998_02470 [Firmicutes bacterium]|nr:hypothetical protein [Bacillota bacterium]